MQKLHQVEKLYKSPVGHNYLFYNYVSVATPKCFIVMHFSLKCNSQWIELISGGAYISSIFDKCPDRLIMRFMAKPYILWKVYFTEFVQNYI